MAYWNFLLLLLFQTFSCLGVVVRLLSVAVFADWLIVCLFQEDGSYRKTHHKDKSGVALCPFDPAHNTTAIYAGRWRCCSLPSFPRPSCLFWVLFELLSSRNLSLSLSLCIWSTSSTSQVLTLATGLLSKFVRNRKPVQP